MSHFDHKANEWDSEQKIKLMGTLALKVKENLDFKEKYDILDFGCGTGLFGLEFMDSAKSLLGVDVSKGMLEVFNNKTKDFSFVSSQELDLATSDLDRKFDLIVSSMAFHHLQDPKLVLGKLKSMLSPGGRIVIVDLDQEDGSFHPNNKQMGVEHFGFSQEELEAWGKELQMNFSHTIINKIEKNDTTYGQFMAVYIL